ncbi:hypothetical protein BD410DRAFT_810149 [Rickenella mellea]|uniref:Uncharacterized protein n=1 Tax=Rickenella mellea TaxID=50990 RepID=A0A4Y7PEX8_9AGAM|nr:hypothetical protein BD410DRAFT_810149 [Rickenella mellea]
MILGDEKITRFNPINPSIFRRGQLVEIQVSFSVRKDGTHFKIMKVLRSIALLSDEHVIEAHVARVAALRIQRPIQQPLKRRIGYIVEEEDDVVQTRQTMAKLVIKDMFEKDSNDMEN